MGGRTNSSRFDRAREPGPDVPAPILMRVATAMRAAGRPASGGVPAITSPGRLLRAVRCPPLILSDIVARHELRRQKLDGRSWLLPVENADADLHGAARHEEWVLRGGGLDLLRLRILEGCLDIGCGIDRG